MNITILVLGTLSIARAIAQHESSDPTSLNFSNGKDIRVTTKLDNPHSELWGGEVTLRLFFQANDNFPLDISFHLFEIIFICCR